MRIALFAIMVVIFAGATIGFDRYSAAGLRTARAECAARGILRVQNPVRWRALLAAPQARPDLVRVSRNEQPDSRFYRTVTRLSSAGRPVAELNVLRFYPVTITSWLGLGTPSPAFVCAWDVRRLQYLSAAPLFS